AGACTAAEYWGAVAAAVGIQQLSETEGSEVQEADNRYFLRLDPAARALIHDLARNEVPMVLLSNASQAFGEAVRRADWFEAFGCALTSGDEELAQPDRRIDDLLLGALSREAAGGSIPPAVIFFDDREDHVAAARELGIDAHQWPRNGEEHPEGTAHGADIARAVLASKGIPLD